MVEGIVCFCERQDTLGTFSSSIYVLQMGSSFTLLHVFPHLTVLFSQTNYWDSSFWSPASELTQNLMLYILSIKESNKSQICTYRVLETDNVSFLAECLSQMPKALSSISRPFKLGMMMQAWILSTWKWRQEVQKFKQLHRVITFLSYKRLCLKQQIWGKGFICTYKAAKAADEEAWVQSLPKNLPLTFNSCDCNPFWQKQTHIQTKVTSHCSHASWSRL